MKLWLVCLVVVFGISELYQWFQALALPMPLYGAAGLLLALFSNADQWIPQFRATSQPKSMGASQTGQPIEAGEIEANAAVLPMPPSMMPSARPSPMPLSQSQAEPQLPNLSVAQPSSISFEIRES